MNLFKCFQSSIKWSSSVPFWLRISPGTEPILIGTCARCWINDKHVSGDSLSQSRSSRLAADEATHHPLALCWNTEFACTRHWTMSTAQWLDLPVKAKVAKVKANVAFTKPVVKLKAKVLHQPFGEGGKGGKGKDSLAKADVVQPTATWGSLQHSSLPHLLTPGGRPFRTSLRLMNQARMKQNSRCWSWQSWTRLLHAWLLNFCFPLPPLLNHLCHLCLCHLFWWR